MRFAKGHKATTRRQILEVASKCFNRQGILSAGIAGIMGEAGLTNGGFYSHFQSKEALVHEVLAGALASRFLQLEEELCAGVDIEGAIRGYLSRDHLEDTECGCPSAALLSEIVRQPAAIRQTYDDGLQNYVSTLARLLPNAGSEASLRRAMAIFGLMVGTLQFARAVPDRAQAKSILEGGVEAALCLARTPVS
jgi:TetR/AcrR family transcriptional regulator, transcriptional repressor for nem operon